MSNHNSLDGFLHSNLHPKLDIIIQGELCGAITGETIFLNILVNSNGIRKSVSSLVTMLEANEGIRIIDDIWNLIARVGVEKIDISKRINSAPVLELRSLTTLSLETLDNMSSQTTSGRNIFEVISEITIHLLAILPPEKCQELISKSGYIYNMLGLIMPEELITYLHFITVYPGNVDLYFLAKIIEAIMSDLNSSQLAMINNSKVFGQFQSLKRFIN